MDWFTRDKEIHSLSQAPEPKRRFMPSKWEEKKCVTRAFNTHTSLVLYRVLSQRKFVANVDL